MHQIQNQINQLRNNVDHCRNIANQLASFEQTNLSMLQQLINKEQNAANQLRQISQICSNLSQQLSSLSSMVQNLGQQWGGYAQAGYTGFQAGWTGQSQYQGPPEYNPKTVPAGYNPMTAQNQPNQFGIS